MATVGPNKTAPSLVRWLVALLVLNGLDLLFTLYYVESGQAVEANPLMAVAYEVSAAHFALVKMTLACLGLGLLYRVRHAPAARLAVRAVTAAYALLVVYHVVHLPLHQGMRIALL